jgi:hypothetical protein
VEENVMNKKQKNKTGIAHEEDIQQGLPGDGRP